MHESYSDHRHPGAPLVPTRELYPALPEPGSPDLLRLIAQASEHVQRLLGTGVSIVAGECQPQHHRLEISRGDSLIGFVYLDLSRDSIAHLHSLLVTPEPGGTLSRDYQAGTALLAAAISLWLSSSLPMLYWTISIKKPDPTGFYEKFFDRYDPLLRWLGVYNNLIPAKTEKEGDNMVLVRSDVPLQLRLAAS